MSSVEEKFWARVNKDGPTVRDGLGPCWEWTASTGGGGYGHMWHPELGKLIDSHRLSWLLTHGDAGGLCVLHKCDNRLCVNPDHLFLGTKGDNFRDAIAKGRFRQPRGEAAGMAKLSNMDIRHIRMLSATGIARRRIGKIYGVSISAIQGVVKGRSWTHLPSEQEGQGGEHK